MSRIGNKIIVLPAGVSIDVAADNTVTVKGPKGELTQKFDSSMEISVEGTEVSVKRPNDTKQVKMLHGTTRALIANMVTGVSEGYKKELEIKGVGYRVMLKGNTLEMNMGYSHKVEYVAEEGITLEAPSQVEFSVSGIDKQRVGEVAAYLRGVRGPEPYKGKGIRYKGEHVRRKEGKKAK